MSPEAGTSSNRNGAFISTRDIYDQVNAMNLEVTQLKTTVKVLSLFITPILSTACAVIIPALMKG